MKKVLSLVLAVMMVVGMTTVAFAAFAADSTAPVVMGSMYPGEEKTF